MHSNDQNLEDALAYAKESMEEISKLCDWILEDEEMAEEEGRVSMKDLLVFVYGGTELIGGENLYADEQLTCAGLLRPQTKRTVYLDSWKTGLGRFVAESLGIKCK